VITGASSGLGRRLAGRFWLEGFSLFLVARNEAALSSLAASLAKTSREAQDVICFSCDLSLTRDVELLADRLKSEAVTALINNAASLGPIGSLWENDLTTWQLTLFVDLFVPAALCAAVIPGMLRRQYGKIVNISGGGAASPRPNLSAYACAKTGLVRLTEVLAHETKGAGIDVNCIAPGAMNTRMMDQVLEAGPQRAGTEEYERARRQAAEGGTSPDRAADLALFLASSASDGISGRLLSAVWDRWENLAEHKTELQESDVYTLRRIVPKDRGLDWV